MKVCVEGVWREVSNTSSDTSEHLSTYYGVITPTVSQISESKYRYFVKLPLGSEYVGKWALLINSTDTTSPVFVGQVSYDNAWGIIVDYTDLVYKGNANVSGNAKGVLVFP